MNNKRSRQIILVLIVAAVAFVVFDFISASQKQKQAQDKASQQEETVVNNESVESENKEFTTEQEADFETNDELPSDDELNTDVDPSPEISYGANPGDTAYDYDLIDIESGELVKLSDYRGQKVFLNFWASWCPPCRVEAPHLQSFSENQDEVVVLGVNVRVSESKEENIQAFIDEFDLTFQNVYGPEEMFGSFYVESLPTSFFIDSNGIIRERVTGPVTEDVLQGIFDMMD